MSVEKITSRILDDARERAEEILVRAGDEKQKLLAHTRADAARGAEEILQFARKNAEANIKKTQSLADLEGKKEILKAKQDCINHVYRLALDKIAGMEEEEYFELLKKMVKRINPQQAAVIQFNERDKKRFHALKVKWMDFHLKVSEEAGNFEAGFLLHMGETSINCTFDEILKSVLEDHTKEIADILFSK